MSLQSSISLKGTKSNISSASTLTHMTTILPLVPFESNSNHTRNKAKPGKNRKHENCITVYQIIIISYCHILLMHTHKKHLVYSSDKTFETYFHRYFSLTEIEPCGHFIGLIKNKCCIFLEFNLQFGELFFLIITSNFFSACTFSKDLNWHIFNCSCSH